MTITIKLMDETGLSGGAQAFVCGWINGSSPQVQVLHPDGTFTGSNPQTAPFYPVSSVPTVKLDKATNGNERLVFVVATQRPAPLTVSNHAAVQYTQYPYFNPPGVAAPGPFDFFEFGMNAQADLSAVNGFGLNLRFTANMGAAGSASFGVSPGVKRHQIKDAFNAFVKREALYVPSARVFGPLLYDKPIFPGAPQPPLIDGQFFAISDPNDLLGAYTGNYAQSTTQPLATYWNSTLTDFFTPGNFLSINISAGAPVICSGECNHNAQYNGPAYTLTNSATNESYVFPSPLITSLNPLGFSGAQYVFQQALGNSLAPNTGAVGSQLQLVIWEALCRGVALDGVYKTKKTQGESTTAWNNWQNWYKRGIICDFYAKFLHYSDIHGDDCRHSGLAPIMIHNAAYGFSVDENPDGPYNGQQVPSKTVGNVPDGSTITLTLGPWN